MKKGEIRYTFTSSRERRFDGGRPWPGLCPRANPRLTFDTVEQKKGRPVPADKRGADDGFVVSVSRGDDGEGVWRVYADSFRRRRVYRMQDSTPARDRGHGRLSSPPESRDRGTAGPLARTRRQGGAGLSSERIRRPQSGVGAGPAVALVVPTRR